MANNERSARFADGSEIVIGACIEVHRQLGPGLLETTYESCLCHELTLRGIPFRRQVPVPLSYKGLSIDCAYRIDLVVAERILVELKVVERLLAVHTAQALTYLRLTGLGTALLVNFDVPVLRLGLRRLTSKAYDPANRGRAAGTQEGGESGRSDVGRHFGCGGMDRVSPLSGLATRARR